MTDQEPLADNPWGPPAPKPITRDDRVELAARALMGYPADRPWSEDDLTPIETMGYDQSVRDIFVDLAVEALDATYPALTSAMELDALPVGALIVSDSGNVYRRALVGGLNRVNGHEVGTLEVWEQPGERETGRKIRRTSSATLALSGPWTVVWTRVSR